MILISMKSGAHSNKDGMEFRHCMLYYLYPFTDDSVYVYNYIISVSSYLISSVIFKQHLKTSNLFFASLLLACQIMFDW